MNPNPLLKKLGYSNTDRLVIIHVDDVGMCQASLQGFADLWEFGTISSGAVMVPCPWFRAVVDWARQHPDVDLGVHGTVNSEWDGYRWGPISTRDPATGLLDEEGYFHKREPAVQSGADPEAVRLEIEAQLSRALQAGLDVTHLDTHMGTIIHPRFIGGYLQILGQARLPGLVPRLDAAGLMNLGLDEESARMFESLIRQLEEGGTPTLDAVEFMPLDDPENQIDVARHKLSNLPPGITHFLMHPAVDTPELRAITPDWPSRVANYQAFMSQEIKDFIKNAGIHVIGYRPIRDASRQ